VLGHRVGPIAGHAVMADQIVIRLVRPPMMSTKVVARIM
jgi:hypothetical protein